ncbi:cytochrome P450 [Russula compacta]|nr:cytochrome P450 [Russula compacta]
MLCMYIIAAIIVPDFLQSKKHRPFLPLAHFNLAITRYSQKWRVERRIVDQSLRPATAVTYHAMQIAKAHAFLRQVLRRPGQTTEYIRQCGYDVKESGDHFVRIADELVTLASESMLPGALLVNDFPALRYLLDWFPGTGFNYEMVNAPFDMVKEDLARHYQVFVRGVVLMVIFSSQCKGEEEIALKNAAASMYAGGAETTVSTLWSFLLALLLYPDVEKRAHAEIDRTIGRTRLPAFSDRPSLPYVDAICKELIRWRLPLPLGIAHATTEDDVYGRYFIPKGTTVLPNTWAILHDPDVYPDPEAFKPERFLTEGGKLKEDPICPGRHLVDSIVWVVVASVLAAFKVDKKIDERGKEIAVEDEYKDGLISYVSQDDLWVSALIYGRQDIR